MWLTDEKNFERLFREHYSLLCNYTSQFIADRHIAEDIVQNFFITIWEKKNLSVNPDNFLPYAYRSLKNSCINYYKAEIIKDDFFINLSKEWQENLQEEHEDFIYKDEVRKAFNKLPEKCRKIFLLKCVSGLRYKEIAELSNISVNTVKYHLGEAFRIMREELKNLTFFFFLFFF